MKPRSILFTALALTLPAWVLSAQETQPPRPPEAPRPPASRADGQGEREGRRRPEPGLFGALDANRDGSVDAHELSLATEVLRKMDRDGDGRLRPDEFHGPGEHPQPRRPEAGRPHPEAGRQAGPDGERAHPRKPEVRPEGHRKPPGEVARCENRGDRCPQCNGPRRKDPASGPPQARGRQSQGGHHPQHHRPDAHDGRPRFAHGGLRMGPQHPGLRPPQESKVQAFARSHHRRHTLAPQMLGYRPESRPQSPPDFRQDQRPPGPQDFHHKMRPPQGRPDRGPQAGHRHGPPPPQPPQFGPGPRRYEPGPNQRPPQMDQRRDDRGPAMHGPHPELRRDFGPRPPGPRDPGQRSPGIGPRGGHDSGQPKGPQPQGHGAGGSRPPAPPPGAI